jgi:outer membrane protein TolC
LQQDALAGTLQPLVLPLPRRTQSHRRATARVFAPWMAASLLWLLQSQGAAAQTPAASTPPPTSPPTLPLSGVLIPSESVTVTQQTSPSATPGSSNVINSTVTILPPFTGSTPLGKTTPGVLSLTLQQALAMGLRTNLGAIEQSAQSQQAEAQRGLAEAGLLPNLNAGVAEAFERENLRTLGVSLQSIPESSKFNYYDARFRLQQSVLDLVKLNSFRTASDSLRASLLATRNTRDLIVLAVAGSYLQLISTDARVVAAEAQVATSRAIYQQAADRFEAGLAARVDRDRAQVQYQTEQQRLRSLQADRDTQKLKLSRLVGLPLGQSFAPADDFPFTPLAPTFDESTSLARAQAGRSDIQAAGAGVRAAQNNVRAAHAERFPTLNVDANFGAAGTTPSFHSTGVYTVYGLLAVPIYEGGRIRADERAADAALKQRQAELSNAHAQADQDVRQAFIDLNAAADQVAVAQSNVQLSHETLTQSRDRFVAGVADTVEVVQAEQAVVQADDDLISAVFEHNLAKVSLARAMGNAEQTLPQLLGRK